MLREGLDENHVHPPKIDLPSEHQPPIFKPRESDNTKLMAIPAHDCIRSMEKKICLDG